MEPVSLAVGVVPLALNIVQMTSAIKEKVSTYKSASAEIQDIVEKTTFIGQICEHLDVAMILSAPRPRFQIDMLDQALRKCCKSVANVQKDVNSITKSDSSRKRSLNYVLGKANIDKSLYSLNDSINMLHTCMSFNLLTSANHQNESAEDGTLSSKENSSNSPDVKPVRAERVHQELEKPRFPLRTHRHVLQYKNVLCHYKAAYSTSQDDGEQIGVTQRRSYLIGLPLVGTYISIAMRYGPLKPFELAINTPRFIYEAHDKPLFDEIVKGHLKYFDAVKEPRAHWAQRLELAGNTQLVSQHGLTTSLIGLAVALKNDELLRHFSTQGTLTFETHDFLASVIQYSAGRSAEELHSDPVTLYMKLRGPFLTLKEYSWIMSFGQDSSYHMAIFRACKDYFVDDWDSFIDISFRRMVEPFKDSVHTGVTFDSSGSSGRFMRELIDHGLDVHRPLFVFPFRHKRNIARRRWTSLFHLIRQPFSIQRWEVIQIGERWLQTLQSCSIDLDRYLEHELQFLAADIDEARVVPTWWSSSGHLTKLEFIHDLVRPELAPSGEEGSTDDLLKLLPAFRCFLNVLSGCMQGRIPSHLDWKHERTNDSDIFSSWPFHKDPGYLHESDRHLKNLSQRQLQLISTHDKFIGLMDERFERNQRRKWQKLIKGNHMNQHSINMPGSWTMEWWEYRGSW